MSESSIRAQALRDAANAVFDTALDAEVATWLRQLADAEEYSPEIGDLVEVSLRGEVTFVSSLGDQFGLGEGETAVNLPRYANGLSVRNAVDVGGRQ